MSTLLGRYRLIRRIAHGGMGEVFLASQQSETGLERHVAIKKMVAGHASDPHFAKRFWDEMRIAIRLSHPHIVHTYDCVADGDERYLVQEYVDGQSVRDLGRRTRGPLPVGIALRICADVASALAYAHSLEDETGGPMRVVHRDISPHNILVARDGTAKLIDFGIAKYQMQLHQTAIGSVSGTRGYMAPEQAAGAAVDGRTDVFSLSVVLWEMLAGVRLFDQSGLDRARLASASQTLLGLCPAIDDGLAAIVVKGLDVLPEKRWQSAEDLAIALEHAIADRRLAATSIDVGRFVRSEDHAEPNHGTESMNVYVPTASLGVGTSLEGAGTEVTSTASKQTYTAQTVPGVAQTFVDERRGSAHLSAWAALAVMVAIAALGVVVVRQVWFSSPTHRLTIRPMRLPSPAATGVKSAQVDSGSPALSGSASPFHSASPTPPVRTPPEPEVAVKAPLRAAAAPVERTGRISLDSIPPAHVYLGSRLVGTTPIRRLSLPVGLQLFTFETAEGTRVTRALRVEANRQTHARLDLR